MTYGAYIKEIGRGAHGSRDLALDDARQLYAAMLDGGVPDLELGAIILGLRVKGESLDEMLGFMSAADDRIDHLEMPQLLCADCGSPRATSTKKPCAARVTGRKREGKRECAKCRLAPFL